MIFFFKLQLTYNFREDFSVRGTMYANMWHIAKSRVLQIDYIVDTVKDKEIVKSTC